MVNIRKETYGPGATKGVDLVVMAYDKRVSKNKDTNEVSAHYLDARVHPEAPLAEGQTSLALITRKDAKSPSGYNNTEPYSVKQFEAIKEAAGDNQTPILNKAGEPIGTAYGAKCDVFINKKGDLTINTKTLEASEKTVQPSADGKTIVDQMYEKQAANKTVKEAAKAAAKDAPAAEAPAVEAPAAEADGPELG